MEIRQIEYILAIYEEKNISRAADKLHISQPALSQQLLRLEEKYGVQFFQRNSRNLKLTPAGEVFLEKGRQILDLQREAERELSEYSDTTRGSFTVGVSPCRCTTIVADVFPLFMKRFPQYKVQIIERSFDEIEDMLKHNELDLGFNGFMDNAPEDKVPFSYRLIEREEIQFAVSKNHPLAHLAENAPEIDLPTVNLNDFRKYGFALTQAPSNLRLVAEQCFASCDIDPTIAFEVHDLFTIYNVMSKTDLCTFIPERFAPPDSRQLHFHLSPRRYWDFSICWLPTHYITKAEAYFIRLCCENQLPACPR